MTTFKQKILAGEIKRADAMKVRYEDLHEEPGFNLRIEDADFAASIEALAEHITQGGQYPALEVRPRPDGGVWIVDGHRRKRAIGLAIERGAPLQDKDGVVWIRVEAFSGNDADRVARIITSAEGRALKPLEVAEGYKRLRNLGWDNTRIAKTVGKTPQHVAQALTLADANSDVHKAVADGTVSAAVAVGIVREHGENAGKVIAQEADKARAQGKGKVTAGTIKGKALPANVTTGALDALDAFMATLPTQARERLAAIEFSAQAGLMPEAQQVSVRADAMLALLKAHAEVTEARKAQEVKAREAAAQAGQQAIKEAA